MAKFRDAKHPGSARAAGGAGAGLDAAIADQVQDLKLLVAELGRLRPLRDPISHIDHDLTPPQVHSLLWLRADGPLAASLLSQRVGCGQPTITGVIDRLEKLGYVERERDTDDRRVVRARLTQKGTALGEQLEGRITDKLTGFLSVMDASDRAHLVRILRNVVDKLRKGSAEES